MKTETKNAKKLHKGRAFSYALADKYVQKFIDPKTGKFYPKHVRMRACPVCGSKKSQIVFFKDGGNYVKCEKCTMIFPNPVFKEASLREFYEIVDSGQAKLAVSESAFYREIYSKGLRTITNFVKPSTILDVGCGSGFFLDIAKEKKWITTGDELNQSDAKIARSHGHRVFTDRIEEIDFKKEKFSAITLWDVFEHIVDGRPFLKTLSKLLTPEGVVFMQIPNSGSLAARIMQEKCNMFHTLGHVSLYNPDTIERMAKRSGFKIVHMETVISEIAVMNNYLNYEHPYFGSAPGTEKLLGFLSADDIHAHKLGYKMQIVMKPVRK
jgi:2-polyprenyl-3-methyl-5-hydroxy-6-metoxy-1,4-benzoquinol methylase